MCVNQRYTEQCHRVECIASVDFAVSQSDTGPDLNHIVGVKVRNDGMFGRDVK